MDIPRHASPFSQRSNDTLQQLIMHRPQTNHRQTLTRLQYKSMKNLDKKTAQTDKKYCSELPKVITAFNAIKKKSDPTVTNTNNFMGPKLGRNTQQNNEELKFDLKKMRSTYSSASDILKQRIRQHTSESNFFKNLSKQNTKEIFTIQERTEVNELIASLTQLQQEQEINSEIITQRSNRMKEILDLYSSKIQYDEFMLFKEKDIQRMNEHLKALTDSIQTITKTELQLNERGRELARIRLENSIIKNKMENLEKQISRMQQETKDMKNQYTIAKEVEQQNNMKLVQDQNLINSLNKKIEILEKTIEYYKDPTTQGSGSKYKGTINFLIKESQDLKKDIQLKKRIINNKDKEIYKLISKIQKLSAQLDSDLDQEELKKLLKRQKGGTTSTPNSIYSEDEDDSTFMNEMQLPSINRFDEPSQNLKFRLQQLPQHQMSVIRDLQECGSQFFVEYLLNKKEQYQIKDKIMTVSEYMLKSLKFIDKLHGLLHFLTVEIKTGEEIKIIEKVSKIASKLIARALRVQLWVKDIPHNELWTTRNRHMIVFDANFDVIGQCNKTQNNVFIETIDTCAFADPKFDEAFKQADQFSFKERESVLALPIKHPRTEIVIGVLEICSLRMLQKEDLFISDGLKHICGILISRFQDHQSQIRKEINLKSIIQNTYPILRQHEDLFQKTRDIEQSLQNIFNVSQAKFLIIDQNQNVNWYGDLVEKEVKTTEQSIAQEMFQKKAGTILQSPLSHYLYNGLIDIESNSPLLIYPVYSLKILAQKTIIGAFQIPQTQLKGIEAQKQGDIQEFHIPEEQREVLDNIAFLIGQSLPF